MYIFHRIWNKLFFGRIFDDVEIISRIVRSVTRHFVSFISPGRLSASLELLHTLWFTLHTTNKSNEDVNGEEKPVRLPPNLAQECSLVCWTLLEQLR